MIFWLSSILLVSMVSLIHGRKNQLTPILIKDAERKVLLANIYENKHHEIVKFFRDNSLIDYSLIRFHHTDHPEVGNSVHGFTPLAAAIRFCKPETVAVLGPVQKSFPWTMSLATGYSSLELCAAHCPDLLKNIILNDDTHILRFIIDSPTPVEIFNVLRVVHLEENENLKEETKLTIKLWIQLQFDHENVRMTDGISKFWHKINVEDNFKDFMSAWVDSEYPVKFSLLQSIFESKPELFKIAVKKSLLAGKLVDFESELEDPEFIIMVSEVLTPEHLKKIKNTGSATQKLVEIFKSRNFDDEFRNYFNYLDKYVNLGLSAFDSRHEEKKIPDPTNPDPDPKKKPDFGENMSEQFDAMGANTGFVSSLFSKKTLLRIFRKYLPYAYKFYQSRNPHLDTMIKLNENFTIYETGTQKTIEPDFITTIKGAFKNDDPEPIKNIFEAIDHQYSQQDQVGKNEHHWLPDELRIVFGPYQLTILKAAVMLKKPNIIQYLVSRKDFNLYATTQSQLSALELAACYNSQDFSKLVGTFVTSDCNQRVKAVNHLIRMYSEKIFQKCPYGAQSAEIVFKTLFDTKGLECFSSDKKDAVAESIRTNWPASLIKAFDQTSLYKNYERYIAMAAERGDSELITYFVEKLGGKPSIHLKSALATYVKHMDPKLTQKSVSDLEKMIKLKGVDLNAREPQSGATALSHAAQKTILWVVKRLLLEKDLDINKADIVTNYIPIQHSITLFFAEKLLADPQSEPMLIQAIRFMGKELEIPIPGFLIKILTEGLLKLDKDLIDFKDIRLDFNQKHLDSLIENLKNQEWINELDPIFKAALAFFELFLRSKLKSFINLPMVDAPLLVIETIKQFMELEILKTQFMDYAPAVFFYGEMIIESIESGYLSIANFGKKTPLELTGDNNEANGMIHNCLLSHPRIDTTLSNYLDHDTLFIVKRRAIQLQGSQKASDEMERTHFRVINKNSELAWNNLTGQIIYGAIITLIAGSASVGFIRLLL